MSTPRVIIVMGVAGSGKSTVAARLAAETGGHFHDADDFHPAANILKMASGIPLDDADRSPWLARMRAEIIDAAAPGPPVVLACSALKKSYRTQLGVGHPDVALVYLKGDAATLAARLANRAGHYMKAGMLESQLATLEEPAPDEGITVSIHNPVEAIVAEIQKTLATDPCLNRKIEPQIPAVG